MKVSELIEALKEVEQDKQVFFWEDGRIIPIGLVDELTDRIDLNAKEF